MTNTMTNVNRIEIISLEYIYIIRSKTADFVSIKTALI